MKHDSHIHLDVTVPFKYSSGGNFLEAPKYIQDLIYPRSAEGNPMASFLENVNAPCNVRINIHISAEPE